MRTFFLHVALALSLGVITSAPAWVSAQVADAGELFHRAERAFADEDYDQALQLFRAAYDAAPHPAVRFHIARSLEQLGRLREAWSEMTEVAAASGLTTAQRRDARRQAERLRAMLVTLRVDGAPAGTDVRVDDAVVGTLPCEVPVDPGEHEVSVQDATGRASMRISGLNGSTLAVHLVIEPPSPPPEARVASPPVPAPDVTPPIGEGPATPALPSPPPASPRTGGGVGWLLVTGSVVTAIGIAGVIGFGLHATSLHDAYQATPTPALLHDGPLFVDLTNASIGVLAVGAVLAIVDLALALAGEGTEGRAARFDGTARF